MRLAIQSRGCVDPGARFMSSRRRAICARFDRRVKNQGSSLSRRALPPPARRWFP